MAMEKMRSMMSGDLSFSPPEEPSPLSEHGLDKETVLRCMEVIKKRSLYLQSKGMNSWAFFLGVTNVLVVTWCFAAVPENFWIVYVLETLTLFPIVGRRWSTTSPLVQVCYWLDFCWVANFLCNIGLFIYLIDAYFENNFLNILMAFNSDNVREALFCMFFGIATGPLLCAVGALGNALVFHDIENTCSVFIHLCPSLLAFTMRWHADLIRQKWPGLFHLDYLDDISPWTDIYGRAALAYMFWLLCYTSWMLCCGGLTMPQKGYDTIFHYSMRGSNPVDPLLGWKEHEKTERRQGNDFTPCSVILYMFFHAVSVLLGMTVSVACFVSKPFHQLACLAMTLVAIWKAASRYSYYILDMYTIALKKEFGEVLNIKSSGHDA